MRYQEGFFTGIRGADIYYQCWLPEDKPRAVLLIVHGLAEHSGRYISHSPPITGSLGVISDDVGFAPCLSSATSLRLVPELARTAAARRSMEQ